jgi:hypothetical protein
MKKKETNPFSHLIGEREGEVNKNGNIIVTKH